MYKKRGTKPLRSNMGPFPQPVLCALLLSLMATLSLGNEGFGLPRQARFLRTQSSPPTPVSSPHIFKSPPPSLPRSPPPPPPPPPRHHNHHHPPPPPKNCDLPYPPPPPKISSPSPRALPGGRRRPTPPTPVSSPRINPFLPPPSFRLPPPPPPPPPPPILTPPPYMR